MLVHSMALQQRLGLLKVHLMAPALDEASLQLYTRDFES